MKHLYFVTYKFTTSNFFGLNKTMYEGSDLYELQANPHTQTELIAEQLNTCIDDTKRQCARRHSEKSIVDFLLTGMYKI